MGKESEKVRWMREDDEAIGIRNNYLEYEGASGIFAMLGLGVMSKSL